MTVGTAIDAAECITGFPIATGRAQKIRATCANNEFGCDRLHALVGSANDLLLELLATDRNLNPQFRTRMREESKLL